MQGGLGQPAPLDIDQCAELADRIQFETDDARDQALTETEGAGYDLLLLDSTALTAYRKRGWIRPLDPAAVPNRRFLEPRWAAAYPESQDAAVPYLWRGLRQDRPRIRRPAVPARRGPDARDRHDQLGPRLHLRVIAEGIETQDQLEALRALGCDLGQGYLFARPAAAAVAARLLAGEPRQVPAAAG